MNLKSTGTVGDLQIEMAGYRDAGVAMQIQAAINKLINLREINQKDELSPDVLRKIHQKVSAEPDPMLAIMGALSGGSGNPMEAALTYLESLM